MVEEVLIIKLSDSEVATKGSIQIESSKDPNDNSFTLHVNDGYDTACIIMSSKEMDRFIEYVNQVNEKKGVVETWVRN